MSIILGAIADDFTGATDLANTLVKKGMRVLQVFGVPEKRIEIREIDAVIIALKSRTISVKRAVQQSLSACKWLKQLGARQYFFKYCSTFDSTCSGNIGPVADALMEFLSCEFAFVCPAFPENGRSIYQGHLFVGNQLLSESSMKHHPLTPMNNSNLIELMSSQSEHNVGLISFSDVNKGEKAITNQVANLKNNMVLQMPYLMNT